MPALAFGRRAGREVVDAVWSLLFPERCVGCGEFETLLCDTCRGGLEPLDAEVCGRCGHPGPVTAPPMVRARPFCPHCAGFEPSFARARSAFVYEGVARRLVSSLKNEGRRNLGSLMAELAGDSFNELIEGVGEVVVTWAPAHRSTTRTRGYNQAEVLARHLARQAGGLPVAPLARKVGRTRHQKALGREQRRQNLRGAFVPLAGPSSTAHSPMSIGQAECSADPGTRGVVMVDDVYTTGATAQEVADVIGRSTGLPVYVFTFCRTVAAGDGSLA